MSAWATVPLQGGDSALMIERGVVDVAKRKMTLICTNVTWGQTVQYTEVRSIECRHGLVGCSLFRCLCAIALVSPRACDRLVCVDCESDRNVCTLQVSTYTALPGSRGGTFVSVICLFKNVSTSRSSFGTSAVRANSVFPALRWLPVLQKDNYRNLQPDDPEMGDRQCANNVSLCL